MSRSLDIPVAECFEPLLAPMRYKGAWGGRGSGKSHTFADLLVDNCVARPGLRAICIREVQKSLKDSVKFLLESKINEHEVGHLFKIRKDDIVTPGGGLIVFIGLQDHTAESLKSFEGFDVAYVEEAQSITARSLELMRPTVRKPGSELWFSWNPRHASDPVDMLFRGPNPPPDSVVINANYDSNPFFTAELEAERAHDEIAQPDRYGHIWLGHHEPMAIGAIWDRLTLHQGRVTAEQMPELERIVVGVDPPTTANPGSDEAGIIVVGLGVNGRGYVLEDFSTRGTPEKWAGRAVAAYDHADADVIVIETNQGGLMCELTLRTIRRELPIIMVHTKIGKHLRAEPVAALYKLGRVSHFGAFPELEDQMVMMTAAGWEGPEHVSPDRVDALVYALTELFPKLIRKKSGPVDTFDEAWEYGRNTTTGY